MKNGTHEDMGAIKEYWWDLRALAIQYPSWCAILFLGAFFIFGTYGNWRVIALRGGILDDAVAPDNLYRQMHEYVQSKEGFSPQDLIPIIIKLSHDNTTAFREVVRLTQAIKDTQTGGVLSLAELPEYRDTGDALLDDPYLTPQVLEHFAQGDAQDAWRQRVAADASAYGVFIGKNWRWAAVTRFLPTDYDEIQEAWKTVELLEGRSIPWWERVFLKTDIVPTDPATGVTGWVMGRWQIDQAMNRDVLVMTAVGMLLSILILWYYLGSSRQALIAVFINVLGGIWLTRAIIWPLNEMGTGIFERLYTTIAYANVIVQGLSFSLHKFQAFREAEGTTSAEKFLKARDVDAEIGMVALIAILAFLCLNTFPIWQMQEMGYQSAIGVLLVLIGATVFIPAMYIFVERLIGPESPSAVGMEREQFQARWLVRLQIPAWLAVGLPVLTFACAAGLFLSGRIATETKPTEYLKGTLVGETFEFLKGSGHDFLNLLVEPQEGNIYQPDFIQQVWALQSDLTPQSGQASRFEQWQQEQGFQTVVGFTTIASIMGKVRQIAQESLHKELPDTPLEIEDTFFLIEDGIDLTVTQQMWFAGGIRLSGLTDHSDSVPFRRLVERSLRFATQQYPALKVSTFGKGTYFPQVDLYITQGAALNTLVSLGMVFLLYVFWISLRKKSFSLQNRYVIRPLWGGLVMLLPFLFGVGVIGILLWALGAPLSMSTAPFADLAINASGDFSIYIAVMFLLGLSLGKKPPEAVTFALVGRGMLVLTDVVLNIFAFSPLLLSQFQAVRELGSLMGIMLLTCAIGALVFVPSALPLAVKENTPQKEPIRNA